MLTFGKQRIVLLAFALVMIMAAQGNAQGFRPRDSDIDLAMFQIDEIKYLGAKLDQSYTFVRGDGKEYSLKDLAGKPLIMVLSYYTCDGFCPTFNGGLKTALEKVQSMQKVKIGKDFAVMTVSFDKNDNRQSTEMFEKSLGIPSDIKDSWYVATFKNQEDIAKLTSSLGYKFFWSPADKMFFHPNAYFFISPEGRVVRILQNSINEASDMELAILDAKFDKLKPSEISKLALSVCYSYSYKDGKYRLNYPMFISFGSLFTGVAAFLFAANIQRKKVKRGKEITK